MPELRNLDRISAVVTDLESSFVTVISARVAGFPNPYSKSSFAAFSRTGWQAVSTYSTPLAHRRGFF